MLFPISIGFILMMLLFGGVLGKMVIENIVIPIVVIGGIIIAAFLFKKVFSKLFEESSDISEYYKEDDEWNR